MGPDEARAGAVKIRLAGQLHFAAMFHISA